MLPFPYLLAPPSPFPGISYCMICHLQSQSHPTVLISSTQRFPSPQVPNLLSSALRLGSVRFIVHIVHTYTIIVREREKERERKTKKPCRDRGRKRPTTTLPVDLFPARQLTYPRDLTSEVASASASRLRLRIHYRSRFQTLHNYLVYIAYSFLVGLQQVCD